MRLDPVVYVSGNVNGAFTISKGRADSDTYQATVDI